MNSGLLSDSSKSGIPSINGTGMPSSNGNRAATSGWTGIGEVQHGEILEPDLAVLTRGLHHGSIGGDGTAHPQRGAIPAASLKSAPTNGEESTT